MIEAIESVMRHWGESVVRGCSGGALASPMGAVMDWHGAAPRGGVFGSRVLVAGAGPDFLASEVAAALQAVGGLNGGKQLQRLARLRYAFDPALSVDEQLRDLDLGRGDVGRRAYTRAVQRLHRAVLAELGARQQLRDGRRQCARRDGDGVRLAASGRE